METMCHQNREVENQFGERKKKGKERKERKGISKEGRKENQFGGEGE